MDVRSKEGLLKKASELEAKASAAIRPVDKHQWLLCASDVYKRAGCPSAARLTQKLAKEALYGKFADQN